MTDAEHVGADDCDNETDETYKTTQTIWYSSNDCESPERYSLQWPRNCDITHPAEQRVIAVQCADDFYNGHDGRKARWPRDITLYATADGPPMASFEVECEAVPGFYARRKE